MKKMLLGLTTLAMTSALHANVAEHVPGEIVVKFKEGKEKSFLSNKSLSSLGIMGSRSVKLSYGNLTVLKVSENKSLESVLKTIQANTDVVYAEPNFIYRVNPIRENNLVSKRLQKSPFTDFTAAIPDDQKFGQLWGLRNTGSNEPKGTAGVEGSDVNALNAWDITKGSKAVLIAVIDTGVDYNHPDLKENIWTNEKELNGKPGVDDDGNGYIDDIHGYDFANNDSDPMDGNDHGTHCSGTIGAIHNNQVGVAGVMGDVSIVAVKFLGDDGSGSLEAAVKAIDYATTLNVDLMSNSWGGGGRSQSLLDAIQRASDKGIIFTAAAGNSSSNNDASPSYPASYETPNMVAVAATTAQNGLASFSSYGRTSVHIGAPGHNILSTIPGGKYDVFSGTSMATPHVSGVLGLLLAKEGRMPHSVMRERLTMTGVPVAALRGKTQTASRIDAYNLLTDTRPERSGPKNDAWKSLSLSDKVESAHPYVDNAKTTKTITIPGAKYLRVKVAKFDLESGYDYVRIADGAGNTIEKVTGTGEKYTTDYIEGNTVTIDFVSDRSINKWGYLIEEIEVQ
jgi:thermitase